ncbi:MAG: glycosyltransferase [Thermodesulfobacteriota bacterium]|nr:glycosyltransferase [Thermodesulfobacteriota bacterium]
MKVACHYTIPRPPQPKLDAAIQDGLKLIDNFGGEMNFLYPGAEAKKIIPRFLCGLHQLYYLRQLDRRVDLHQIFSNGIYPYPVLRFFKKPVVYTSVIELGDKWPPLSRLLLKKVRKFVVVTDNDREKLKQAGFDSEVILPGIDIDRFSNSPLHEQNKFFLLSGSAPWNEEQFETKGVEVLLQAAVALPWLHLVFLWRGRLLEKMQELVHQYGLSDRVQVIDEMVDVNEALRSVHAAVVLTGRSELVKGYPHSLLEALAAGKPVLVSRCLVMSDYVENRQCGVSVKNLQAEELIGCVEVLRNNYPVFADSVVSLDLDCFSGRAMVASYNRVYQQLS